MRWSRACTWTAPSTGRTLPWARSRAASPSDAEGPSEVDGPSRDASGLRDVEELGYVGGQAEVALRLDLAGHEHHHRVAVARDDLEERDRVHGHGQLRVARRPIRDRAGAVLDHGLVGVAAAARAAGDIPVDHGLGGAGTIRPEERR